MPKVPSKITAQERERLCSLFADYTASVRRVQRQEEAARAAIEDAVLAFTSAVEAALDNIQAEQVAAANALRDQIIQVAERIGAAVRERGGDEEADRLDYLDGEIPELILPDAYDLDLSEIVAREGIEAVIEGLEDVPERLAALD